MKQVYVTELDLGDDIFYEQEWWSIKEISVRTDNVHLVIHREAFIASLFFSACMKVNVRDSKMSQSEVDELRVALTDAMKIIEALNTRFQGGSGNFTDSYVKSVREKFKL